MHFDVTKGLMKGDRAICRFEPLLESVVNEMRADGKMIKNYEVKVRYIGGGESSPVMVKSLNKIDFFHEFGVVDGGLSPSDRASVTAYLQEQYFSAKVKIRRVVNGIGLVSEKPLIYLFDRKTVITNEVDEIIPEETIPEFPGGQYSQETILNYLDRLIKLMPGVSDLLLLVELLAKLKPIFEASEIDVDNFTVVYGVSGTFKTALVKLLCMADERQIQAIHKIRNRRLQEVLSLFRGHTIIADDYRKQGSSYENEKQQVVLDHLGRYGGYSGGAYIVATGEYLEGIFSLQDRMIPLHTSIVEPSEKAGFAKELRWLQENKAILWQFYREFCNIVYSDIQNVKDYIRKEFYVEKYQTPFRIERNTVFLELAYSILRDWYLPKDYSILEAQMQASLLDMKKQTIIHMKKIQRTQYDVDWTYEVCRIIPIPTVKEIFEKVGYYFENGYFYVRMEVLKGILEERLECKVPIKEVISDLKQKKILYTDKSGASTVKRRGGVGVCAISLKKVDEYKERMRSLK